MGKTWSTSMLAVELKRRGLEVGVLDADITGPIDTKVFGRSDRQAYGTEDGILPMESEYGHQADVDQLSPCLKNRFTGSVAGAADQLGLRRFGLMLSGVIWIIASAGPASWYSGDVPLTVFQSLWFERGDYGNNSPGFGFFDCEKKPTKGWPKL